MSYSFSVRALSRAALAAAISDKLDEVVVHQPIHSRDRGQAQAAAEAFASLVGEPPEGHDFMATVSGYLSWQHGDHADGSEIKLTGASVSVSVGHAKVEQQAG